MNLLHADEKDRYDVLTNCEACRRVIVIEDGVWVGEELFCGGCAPVEEAVDGSRQQRAA